MKLSNPNVTSDLISSQQIQQKDSSIINDPDSKNCVIINPGEPCDDTSLFNKLQKAAPINSLKSFEETSKGKQK